MASVEGDSTLVTDDSGNNDTTHEERLARGAAIEASRDAAGMNDSDLARKVGISRQAIARAYKGRAGPGTYRALERFFRDEISGPTSDDESGVIVMEAEGVFGIGRLAVKGPVGDGDEVRRQFVELIAEVQPKSAPAD